MKIVTNLPGFRPIRLLTRKLFYYYYTILRMQLSQSRDLGRTPSSARIAKSVRFFASLSSMSGWRTGPP